MKIKRTAILLGAAMIFVVTGTVLVSNAQASGNQPELAIVEEMEDIELENIRVKASGSRGSEVYGEACCVQLGQQTEESFLGIDGITSADADVSYDVAADTYAVELSLEANADIDKEQEELFRKMLDKTFEKVTLKINY